MKRTMKKHLSLLLAVLMLITSVGFNVIAAGECNHLIDTANPDYNDVIYPTCETKGYTINRCVYCNAEVSQSNPTIALGHKFGEEKYELNTDGSYNKYVQCERNFIAADGSETVCGEKSYELENDEKAVYYLVKFVNNKVTDTYDASIAYTKVAATFKNKDLYSTYVKKGQGVEYTANTPYREKTKEYGKYEFIGWTTDASLDAKASDNLTADNCVSLDTIEANTTFYPVFAGVNVTYEAVFYNLESNITVPQEVNHGEAPLYSFNGQLYPNPEKKDDIVNYYLFNGWSSMRNQTVGVPTEVIESTPIYGDIHYYPAFTNLPKNYTVEFYYDSADDLVDYQLNGEDKKGTFDGINLQTNLLTNPGINAINNNAEKLEKESDKTYYYIWTGKWRVLRDNNTYGTTVDLQNFSVINNDIIFAKDAEGNTIYTGENNTEPKKIIRLVPVYERRLRLYTVDIEMAIPTGEDSDYYRGDAVVHVVDKNGQLAASGRTGADGKFRCYLNYSVPFTVTIATNDGKYLGNATITELLKPADGNAANEINNCLVNMSLNPEYETHCSCIHHVAFLQPIWVRILNLLYTFFNVKYVCCYDMYSTIGPLLDYTPN